MKQYSFFLTFNGREKGDEEDSYGHAIWQGDHVITAGEIEYLMHDYFTYPNDILSITPIGVEDIDNKQGGVK